MDIANLEVLPRSRLKQLLDELLLIADPREAWRVAYPLREVLFLTVCGSIAIATITTASLSGA